MQEPVRDMYRGFEILLILRHIEDGRIETTLFFTPPPSAPPGLAQAAKDAGGSTLHPLDSVTPITDQIEVAHRIVDDMMERHRRATPG
ncbi:conserved protein of unknown function (plasmid) [Pararobbsia alpina]|uniref:hypothetical protein n=1 Tax=Pararobbsia alpina TaxID=621374 RepID=UPI0039A6671F